MPGAAAAGSGGGDERKACAVDASWAIAEELAAAGYATEAALVLDTAVARLAGASTRSAADPAIEVATRIRAADLLLAHTGSTDAPKRLLEGGLALVEGPRLQPHTALRADFYRLLGVALRRRQRFHDALRALHMAAKVAPDSEAADATTVEVVRVHFAVCVETGFDDGTALERLRDATRPAGTAALQAQIPPAEMAATACSLVVCHCLALALLGEHAASMRVLTAASQLHGPSIRAQFGILERCVAASAGIPHTTGGGGGGGKSSQPLSAAPADAADATSPPELLAALPETLVKSGTGSSAATTTAAPKKQHRREETAAAAPEPVWMSRGAAAAVMLLQDLVAAAATAGPHATAKAERVFQDLSKAADGTLRHITAAGTAGLMTPAANAELRLMVGVKLAAFLELSILDVTRGNWAAAGSKLDELSAFMLVFARHTAHFAAPFHAVATVLAVIVGDLAAADGHIAALEACGATSGEAAAHAFVMRCFRAHAAGERRVLNDLVQAFALAGGADDQAEHEDGDDAAIHIANRTHEAISRSPRLALLVNLLRGASQVQSHDWRGATTTLKAVANDARNAFGVASPVVACSLRLLADAHGQSGNAGSSEAAVTMATQVAAGCGDIVGLAQCVAWTVGRMHDGSSSAAAASDSERRAALSKDLHAHTASYHAAVKEAAAAPAVARVLAFLPGTNPDYRRWLSSATAAAGGRPSSSSNNGRLSGASARGSTEIRR